MKKSVRMIIAVVVVVAIVVAGGVLFFEKKNKVPANLAIPEIIKLAQKNSVDQSKNLTDSEKERFDSKYGYTMFYPKGWIVDDSQKEAPVEFIREPVGKAFVAVQIFNDDRLGTIDGRKQVLEEAEGAFAKDEAYRLGSLEWQNEDKGAETNSYFATGSYVENDKTWKFMEIMTFSSSGEVFALRANAADEDASVYGPIAANILLSLVSTKSLE